VEAGKSRKQRRTAKQIYTDLVSLGYDCACLQSRGERRGVSQEAEP
jgi:hypothetical protein